MSRRAWFVVVACVGVGLSSGGAGRGAGLTELVSRANPVLYEINGQSSRAALSRDGRLVAFESGASNLVLGDTNFRRDVFVFDRHTGSTTRVSIDSQRNQGDGDSFAPAISADGRFVAFSSQATNLVAGDFNRRVDIFVHDRQAGTTRRVSLGEAGAEANGSSRESAVSTDGRLVAFVSDASNLVAGDTNGVADVFVHDLSTGTTTRESVDGSGTQGNDGSWGPRIAGEGRYVAFASEASNLVADDTGDGADVFVRDRLAGTTSRIWVAGPAVEEFGDSVDPDISEDGRFVALASWNAGLGDTNLASDVFVHDRQTGVTTRVSIGSSGVEGNGASSAPRISPDGRFVAFRSASTNLVDSDTNGRVDVFLHDRATRVTTRLSVASSGEESSGPSEVSAIAAGGEVVAFTSEAGNLVSGDSNHVQDVFVRDPRLGSTVRIPGRPADGLSTAPDGPSGKAAISADGRYVAYISEAANLVAGDTNRLPDAFLADLRTGVATQVSVDSFGRPADSYTEDVDLSADGAIVVFSSKASNLVPGDTNFVLDIFEHDRQVGTTKRISFGVSGAESNGDSRHPRLSADGRYVAFESTASNLVSGDTNNRNDIFVHDRQSGATTRVSLGELGTQSNDYCSSPAISADGRYVGFVSTASNLVGGDANGAPDVFVHDRVTGWTTRASVDSQGNEGDGGSGSPVLSADGRFVAFSSWSSNLVPDDHNHVPDVFVHDRLSGATARASVDSDGAEGEGGGELPAITADGRYVAFSSPSSHLAAADTNQWFDVFLHDMSTGETSLESVGVGGVAGNGDSYRPTMTPDGRYLAFDSDAHNLVPGDYNSHSQVLLRDRGTGPCEPSATTACLRDGRFEVRVDFRTEGSGGAGEVMSFGGVRAENRDSAFYSFFSPTNFEMGLKVLDACVPELGNRFWVFASGLTDQGWTVRVRDTATGEMQRYDNALGDLSSTFRDASSFSCGGAESTEAELVAPVVEWVADASAPLEVGALAPRAQSESCVPNATTSCLQGGRFRVRANWQTQAASGSAAVMSFLGARAENVDSVFFSFFGATNFELGLKVLDACVPELGDDFWVFASGLTDQGWAVTVEDLVNGRAQSYRNAVGTLSTTFRDPASFPCQ